MSVGAYILTYKLLVLLKGIFIMSDYIKRMYEEADELRKKIKKLDAYINSTNDDDFQERCLKIEQIIGMKKYLSALEKRIEHLPKEEE